MNDARPLPRYRTHPSYYKHRQQLWTQILLPLILAAAVILAGMVLAGLATFRDQVDPGRWAAVSTIWLVLPMMVIGLLLLIVLSGLIYLLALLMHLIPPYSFQAQRFMYRIEAGTIRAADMVFRPALFLELIGRRIRKLLGRS